MCFLGDFNARVGKSTDIDGIFGENTCNRKLIGERERANLVVQPA